MVNVVGRSIQNILKRLTVLSKVMQKPCDPGGGRHVNLIAKLPGEF